MDNEDMHYREKVARLLEEKGWPVSRLAERAKIPAVTASRLVKSPTKAGSALFRMARELDVSLDWLLDDELSWEDRGGLAPTDSLAPEVANRILQLLTDSLSKACGRRGGSR